MAMRQATFSSNTLLIATFASFQICFLELTKVKLHCKIFVPNGVLYCN